MPIYKLSTSHLPASVRFNQPPPSAANGNAVHSENRGHDEANLYTKRPLSAAEREIDFDQKKSSSSNRKLSIIEREIREQLRRESELAALRGLPTMVGVSLDQVDHNEDHHHHHRTPDPSGNYYAVQVLPPAENNRSSSREERKLTIIRSPGSATPPTMTSTTTTTAATFSVNGSKPGEVVNYRRGGHDMVEQKGWDEDNDNNRRGGGQWKERSVDLEVENRENGRWTDWKSQQRNEDAVESGVVVRNAENTEKEAAVEERRSFRESWSPSGDIQRNLHRVQPFEEADSLQSELFAQYVPQNETLIELEIRRTREREEALRAAHGLVSLVATDSDGAEAAGIEVVVTTPRMVVGAGGGGGGGADHSSSQENQAMKKFAESRLRTELEREKRREIDLLREGKIKLLSEQRVPEYLGPPSSSSRGKVSSETEQLRESSAKRRSSEYRNSESEDTAPGAVTAENRTAFSANPRLSYVGDRGATVITRSDAMVPSNGKGNGEGSIRIHSVTDAEQRIEKEIAELWTRESELRQQRHSRNSEIPVEARTAQPEVAADEHGAHAQAAKPPELVVAPTSPETAERRRRQPEPRFDRDYDSADQGRPARLALIDQWERGIIQRGGGITT